MDNIALRQAKKQIIGFITGLPFNIETKRLLTKDVYEEIRAEADKVCLQEAINLEKELKEKEKADEKK